MWTPFSRDRRARFESYAPILTNAQVKALPNTAVELVPAQGATRIIMPIMISLVARFPVAYTNVNAAAAIEIGWLGVGSAARTFGAVFDSNGSILTFAGEQIFPMALGTNNDGSGDNWPPGDELSKYANQPLKVIIDNHGAGNLTGGDADNELLIDLTYKIITLPFTPA